MRYRWDEEQQRLVEAGAPRVEARAELVLDSPYDGLRATDGTDISSKRKWKEYARVHGLAHYSDFEGARRARAKRAAEEAAGEYRDPSLRRDLAEAVRAVRAGYRPAPRASADEGPDGTPTPVVAEYLFKR